MRAAAGLGFVLMRNWLHDTSPRNFSARNARPYPQSRLPGLARLLRVRALLSQREAQCGLAAGWNAGAVAVPANGVYCMRNRRRRRAAGLVASHRSSSVAAMTNLSVAAGGSCP